MSGSVRPRPWHDRQGSSCWTSGRSQREAVRNHSSERPRTEADASTGAPQREQDTVGLSREISIDGHRVVATLDVGRRKLGFTVKVAIKVPFLSGLHMLIEILQKVLPTWFHVILLCVPLKLGFQFRQFLGVLLRQILGLTVVGLEVV